MLKIILGSLLAGLTDSQETRMGWTGALIGFSYFHTREYKWVRKGPRRVALFDCFLPPPPPQSPSGPPEIFFFHPTSQSLSPNLLCSTWKDSGYRSFSPPPPQIPSRSIRPLILTSSLCPLKRRDIFYSCLEGCIIPALPFSLRRKEWTLERRVNKARGEGKEGGRRRFTAMTTNKHGPLGRRVNVL